MLGQMQPQTNEEILAAWQNMQSMQAMNNQMRAQMTQLSQL